MTREEKELALYCLKASSDYHSEVCEECINYPNCDHTIQDDVTETIIKELEQELKWVSVNERLPENFQRVLVTVVNYNKNKVVRVAEYYGRQRIFQIKENHDQWEVGDKGLLAWTPLPEPYKAESEDKE